MLVQISIWVTLHSYTLNHQTKKVEKMTTVITFLFLILRNNEDQIRINRRRKKHYSAIEQEQKMFIFTRKYFVTFGKI